MLPASQTARMQLFMFYPPPPPRAPLKRCVIALAGRLGWSKWGEGFAVIHCDSALASASTAASGIKSAPEIEKYLPAVCLSLLLLFFCVRRPFPPAPHLAPLPAFGLYYLLLALGQSERLCSVTFCFCCLLTCHIRIPFQRRPLLWFVHKSWQSCWW